jgi:Family of unknown function (DUF6247)
MTAMSATVNLSDLLNRPKATISLLESNRRLRLRRRDAEDLVLTTAERAEQDSAAMGTMSRLVTELMRHDPAVLMMAVHVLPAVFPWIRYLPEDARKEFAAEWLDALNAAVSVGTNAEVEVVISAWQATAEVYADPELHAALTRPDDGIDYGPVPPPEVLGEPQAW